VNIRATLLSRDPARFRAEAPHLGFRPEFEWVIGEPAGFAAPAGTFDYLIDLATPSAAEVGAGGTAIVEHCLQGSANLIGFAKTAGVRRVLYASSGAVYGSQPADVERLAEDYAADPATVSPYGQLKQRSEALLLESGLDCVITRGFAFVGPGLPLTEKFAIGSFIRQALAGGPIRIHGDGTPMRSYLYATDLVIWLLTLLLKGNPTEPYNVGSDEALDLENLARAVARATGDVAVEISNTSLAGAAGRYVPSIDKARHELGLNVRVPLATALSRTIEWARNMS
jgi:nucleoside-diphosphate-sugar epimerase